MKLWFNIDCFVFRSVWFGSVRFDSKFCRLNKLFDAQLKHKRMNYVVLEMDMSNAEGNNKPETSH